MSEDVNEMQQEYGMEDFYSEVAAFNVLKGWNEEGEFSPKTMPELIKCQLLRIKEELDETFKAHAERDDVEILDGAVDTLVTSMGLIQLLALAGTDTFGAMREVARNNLMKFLEDKELADETCAYYKDLGEVCEVREVYSGEEGNIYAVIRINDGKLMKPKNHPRVELAKYLKGKGE